MKVLIPGASGLLGRYMMDLRPPEIQAVQGTYNTHAVSMYHFSHWDVTNPYELSAIMDWFRPDVVVHAAGPGSVDWCENPANYEAARHQIVGGALTVINACLQFRAKMVYISTNAVYSGKNPPYDEFDTQSPVNTYGKLKAEAESLFAKYDDALIVRPILMYGWPWNAECRQNWATRIYKTLVWGGEQWLVTDRYTQPTYAGDVARVIWWLVANGKEGAYNVAGPTRCTLYEFGLEVANVFSLDTALIRKATSDEFGIAPRPVDTTYTCAKLKLTLPKEMCPFGIETGLLQMREDGGMIYE